MHLQVGGAVVIDERDFDIDAISGIQVHRFRGEEVVLVGPSRLAAANRAAFRLKSLTD